MKVENATNYWMSAQSSSIGKAGKRMCSSQEVSDFVGTVSNNTLRMWRGFIPTCKKKTDKLCDVKDYDFINIDDPSNIKFFGKSLRKSWGDFDQPLENV